MNLPAEETQPVRMHSETYSSDLPFRDGSFTGIILEALFLIHSRVRALFDFEEHSVLEHTKTVAAGHQQNNSSGSEFPSSDVTFFIVINIYETSSASNQQYFRSSHDISL